MASPAQTVSFQRGDWVWRAYPPVSGGKLLYRNRGPWLVLAKTGPVTYKIQRHAEAGPEIVHVDKLLLYQADFGKISRAGYRILNSQGIESLGCKFVTMCCLIQNPSKFLTSLQKMRLVSLSPTQKTGPNPQRPAVRCTSPLHTQCKPVPSYTNDMASPDCLFQALC